MNLVEDQIGGADGDMFCRNGCGFFGSVEWQGNCSRCWTGMSASEKLEAMAATQQIQLPETLPSALQESGKPENIPVTKPRKVRSCLQKKPSHKCMYCGQKFKGDISRYRAHLWYHQQKVQKFWYQANTSKGVVKAKRKFYKKRPNRYIFLGGEEESKYPSLEAQDSLSVESNATEDSFDAASNLKCRFCEALFTNEDQLLQHEKFHSSQRPYTCLICGQSFKIRGHLARHEIIHRRNEKHSCDFCNATFAKTSQLKVHRVIHLTGEGEAEGEDDDDPLDLELPTQIPSRIMFPKHKKVNPLKIVLGQKLLKPKLVEEEEEIELPSEEEEEEEEIERDEENGLDAEGIESTNVDYIEKRAIEQRSLAGGGKVCTYCNKRCASARDLMEHERKHTGEKPHKCPICSMKTARKSDLTKHMRTMHPTVHCMRCTVCDALFTSQDKYEAHQKIHIPTDLIAPTPPTSYLESSPTLFGDLDPIEPQEYPLALTKHSTISPKPKSPSHASKAALTIPKVRSPFRSQPKAPLACQYCPRVYTIRRDLVEHERTHTGEKPYVCNKCPQRFHRKSNYFRHKQICKGMPPGPTASPLKIPASSSRMFGCFYCDNTFPDQVTLLKHQRSHSPAKEGARHQDLADVNLKKGLDRLFPCQFCNKRFLNRSGLVVHEKSHKGTYAHSCRYCKRRFLTRSGLITHENMHIKNKARSINTESLHQAPVVAEMAADNHQDLEGNADIEGDTTETAQLIEDFQPQQSYAVLPSCDVKVNKKVQAYKCRYCSKVCGKYSNLLVHEKLHTHGNRYKCKKCGKGFDVRRRLKQHENTHKEYICNICTKSFLRHLQLIRHVKSAHKNMSLMRPVSIASSHGEIKPGKRGLLCMYCGHRFCRKNKRLLSHMRSHRKRYGKYWYIKAANVVPVISYTTPELQNDSTNQNGQLPPQIISPQSGTGPFKCRFCEKVCTRKMYLEQHEVIHTANRRFQCNTCGLKFCKLYQLTRHKKKAHKGGKPVPTKMFLQEEGGMEEELEDYDEESEEHFEQEGKFEEEEEEKNHVCHFCNAVCDTRENLLGHEKSHSSEGQELAYTCKFCPMMFYRRTEYERHERTHTGERPYKCNICSKSFNRTWNLKIHKLNVHGIKSSRFSTGMDMPPVVKSPPPPPPQMHIQQKFDEDEAGGGVKNEFTCQFCGKHLLSEWSLRVHERTHLQQEGVHQCRVCGMGFNRDWDLKQHLWTVHKGRMNAKTCNICQKEFANPSNLRKHLKQVHLIKNPFVSKYSLPTDLPDIKDDGGSITEPPPPPPRPRPQPPPVIKTENLYSLKCDKCGKRFRDTVSLRKHKITVCGGGRRQCHICKQVFSNSSNLNRHILSHTGQKSHKCNICQRSFYQSTHLTRHMSLHSGKRPFACNLCKSNFSSQPLLDHHKRSHSLLQGKNKLMQEMAGNDDDDEEDLPMDMKGTGAAPLASIKGYKCQYCDANFIDQGQLQVHERAHLIELPFRCQTCFKLFETNEKLEQHERKHVEGTSSDVQKNGIKESPKRPVPNQSSEDVDQKPQLCGYCTKAFTNANDLKRHVFLVHNVDESTVSPKQERKPVVSSEGTKVYPCVLCRKNFSSSSNRSRHFRIFHKGKKALPALPSFIPPKPVSKPASKPAAVPEEAATFRDPATKRYYCIPCNRSYSSSGNLSKHRRIHHGQKPKVISKSFQKPMNLTTTAGFSKPVHNTQSSTQSSVVGFRKYTCHMCSKTFSNSGNLSRHKRLFHNQRPSMGNVLSRLLQGKQVAAQRSSHSVATPEQPKSPVRSPSKSPVVQQQKPSLSPRTKSGKFACNMCDRSFTQSTNLSRHKRNFHGVKPRVPYPAERLENSKKKEKPDSGGGGVKFGCLYCHEMFSLKSALIEHQATHTTKSSFMCQHCDATFSDSKALVNHEKQHLEADRSMECRFCGQTFTNRGGLTMHERSHKGDKRYQCRQCFKTFFNKAGLMSHERCHAGEGQCASEDMSPKRSRSSSMSSSDSSSSRQYTSSPPHESTNSLIKLNEFTNDIARPHACEWCDKRFLTTTDLKRHIRTHTGEQPYPCPLCPKRFSQSQNLKKHLFVIHKQGMPLASWNLSDMQMTAPPAMPTLTPEKAAPERVGRGGYKCRYCSKVCSALQYLMQHEKVHTGGAPQLGKNRKKTPVKMPFKLPAKGVSSTTESSSSSSRSNGQGRRYHCSMCPKSFGSSGDLTRHIRTHTGEKPFECELCHKLFSRNHHLKLHRESAHTEDEFVTVTPTQPAMDESEDTYPELDIHIKSEPLSDGEQGDDHNSQSEYPVLDAYPDPAAEDNNMLDSSDMDHGYMEGDFVSRQEMIERDMEEPPILPRFLDTSQSFDDDDEMGSEGKQCQFCSKSFITIQDLRRHEVTHNGKEQYMCGVCNTTFSSEDNLISHSLIHSREDD